MIIPVLRPRIRSFRGIRISFESQSTPRRSRSGIIRPVHVIPKHISLPVITNIKCKFTRSLTISRAINFRRFPCLSNARRFYFSIFAIAAIYSHYIDIVISRYVIIPFESSFRSKWLMFARGRMRKNLQTTASASDRSRFTG